MGAKLFGLFIDEAFFFSPDGMPVILPLLGNGAFLVMTSSVGGGGSRSGTMAILDAEFNGTKAVLEINWIRSCDTCAQNDNAERCTHIVQRPQFFQRRSDQELLKALLKPFEGTRSFL